METLTEESQQVVKLFDESTGAWKFVRKDKGPLKSIEIIETMLRRLGLSKNEIPSVLASCPLQRTESK